MTLYRVTANSPVAAALERAAERGKQVAAIVELRARFDEAANIAWARRLEKTGAHVVYGLPNHKIHCKACLVVRQEASGIKRYCHLGTGNYNERTSRLYSDIGLLTARPEFGEDLSPTSSTCSRATPGHPGSTACCWHPSTSRRPLRRASSGRLAMLAMGGPPAWCSR